MINFTAHELELISDSITFELALPLLEGSPDCPRAVQLRNIQSRIESFLQAKGEAKSIKSAQFPGSMHYGPERGY